MSQDNFFYILVSNIVISDQNDDDTQIRKIAQRLECDRDVITSIQMLKRSVDGRRRPPVWLGNYQVGICDQQNYDKILSTKKHGVRAFSNRDKKRHNMIDFSFSGDFIWPKQIKVVVVGAIVRS